MSCTPRALKTAWTTSFGSSMEARDTSQTPSGKPRAISAAARKASRVLPAPPLPVSVNSRVVVRRRLTSLSSLRRPTKLVSSAGRLLGRDLTGMPAISAGDYTSARLGALALLIVGSGRWPRRRASVRASATASADRCSASRSRLEYSSPSPTSWSTEQLSLGPLWRTDFDRGLEGDERGVDIVVHPAHFLRPLSLEQGQQPRRAGKECRSQTAHQLTARDEPPAGEAERLLQHDELR